MQEAHGQTLNTRAGSFPDVFPLADVIGRVAVGMSQIAAKELIPRGEHGENIMMDYDDVLSVSLIGADGHMHSVNNRIQ